MTIMPEQTLSQEDRELLSTMIDKVGHTTVIQELVDQWVYWIGRYTCGIDDDMKKRMMLILIGMLEGKKDSGW